MQLCAECSTIDTIKLENFSDLPKGTETIVIVVLA